MAPRTRDHLWALQLARVELQPAFGSEWLDYYRSCFGVDGALQFEHILALASNFYGHLFAATRSDPFVIMKKAFTRLSRELVENETVSSEKLKKLSQGDSAWAVLDKE